LPACHAARTLQQQRHTAQFANRAPQGATDDDQLPRPCHRGNHMKLGLIVPQGWTGEYDG
jgi:hypothetical protein